MIRYYSLYRRLGQVDGKYAHEVTMDWMNPNYRVLSLEQIKTHLFNLPLSDFIIELIEIFKEDTISYEMIAECLNLKKFDNSMRGELDFPKSKVKCEIISDEHVNNIQVKELVIEIVKPFQESKLSNSLKPNKYILDEYYELHL